MVLILYVTNQEPKIIGTLCWCYKQFCMSIPFKIVHEPSCNRKLGRALLKCSKAFKDNPRMVGILSLNVSLV